MEHEFTQEIKIVLHSHFGEAAEDIYEKSLLLQYLTEIFDIIQNSLQNLAMTGFKIAAQRLQFRQIQCSCGVIFKIRPETADFGGYIENSPGFGSTIHAGLQLSVRRSSCSLAADFRKLDPCWCGFAQTAVSKNRRKRSFGNDPQIYQKFPLKERALEQIQTHSFTKVYLYLDRDEAGNQLKDDFRKRLSSSLTLLSSIRPLQRLQRL